MLKIQFFLLITLFVLPLVSSLCNFSSIWSNEFGQPSFTTRKAGSKLNQFHYPFDIKIDQSSGMIFIVDQGNNRFLRFNSSDSFMMDPEPSAFFGGPKPNCSSSEFNQPSAIVIFNQTCFLADSNNNRVLRFPGCTTMPSQSEADDVFGQLSFTTCSQGSRETMFYGPQAVAIDSDGNLWVGDTYNARIMMFENALEYSKRNPKKPKIIFGYDDQPGCSANQNHGIRSITIDPITNTLWASDFYCNRVLVYNSANKKDSGASADNVIGSNSTDLPGNGECESHTLRNPWGIHYDSSTNQLFVSDLGNDRVLVFEHAFPAVSNASANMVIGQPDFNTCITLQAPNSMNLNEPTGLFYSNETASVFIAENGNNRVSHILCNTSSSFSNIVETM